jgi:hypothetical protein
MAASGTGDASNTGNCGEAINFLSGAAGCGAVSGAGDASNDDECGSVRNPDEFGDIDSVGVSGGCVAVSGAGDASDEGHCGGTPGLQPTQIEAGCVAVSGTGDASCEGTCLAASATGEASSPFVEVSGCETVRESGSDVACIDAPLPEEGSR